MIGRSRLMEVVNTCPLYKIGRSIHKNANMIAGNARTWSPDCQRLRPPGRCILIDVDRCMLARLSCGIDLAGLIVPGV
jgi:hypothetical protein